MKRAALFCLVLSMAAGVSISAASCGTLPEKENEPVTEIQAEMDMRAEYASWQVWHVK